MLSNEIFMEYVWNIHFDGPAVAPAELAATTRSDRLRRRRRRRRRRPFGGPVAAPNTSLRPIFEDVPSLYATCCARSDFTTCLPVP